MKSKQKLSTPSEPSPNKKKQKISVGEIALFGMLAALMFASKKLMEVLPNIHLIGMLIVTETVVFRRKALYPIYTYVFLDGLFGGFATWWLPYLYVWAVLWLMVMILPKNMPKWLKPIVYAAVCGLHGFAFGIIYAPAQALIYGLSFKATLAWIAAGFPFDVIHGISNIVVGSLIVPLVNLLEKIMKRNRAKVE